jgi:hypothetical protein
MKKVFVISVACALASVCFGQSPYVIFDGEDGTNPWGNIGGATVEVVDWLQKDAVNGSDYGATIWRVNENDDWAGGGINLDLDISVYNKIAVDVLKQVEGTVQVELQNGDEKAHLQLPYTPTGNWQTLVFDIPEGWTHLTTLLVAPHLVNTTENPISDDDNENHRMSWDNVVAFYEETEIPTNLISPSNKNLQVYSQNNLIRTIVDEPIEISIYNTTGSLIHRQTVIGEIVIPLNPGIYLVKTSLAVKKVIVR